MLNTLFSTAKDTRHKEIRKDPVLSAGLYNYRLQKTNLDEAESQSETEEVRGSRMASSSDSLAVMRVLVSLLNAKRVVDIGTFTGLSALTFAKACVQDGKVFTIDRNDENLPLAKKHWTAAGVINKIESKTGEAIPILSELYETYGENSFDAGYIDADKSLYDEYYERLLVMVRPGGLILVDNLFWYARVLNTTATEKSTLALQAITDKMYHDNRVDFLLLDCGDGLGVCYLKP
eukprot:g2819.t1